MTFDENNESLTKENDSVDYSFVITDRMSLSLWSFNFKTSAAFTENTHAGHLPPVRSYDRSRRTKFQSKVTRVGLNFVLLGKNLMVIISTFWLSSKSNKIQMYWACFHPFSMTTKIWIIFPSVQYTPENFKTTDFNKNCELFRLLTNAKLIKT